MPDAILTKPARLTDEEYALIKRHSEDGARIVAKFGRLRAAVPIIRHHHERWDGSGYPDGLAGEEIPLEASIVGLADAWDAMTTERPYHRALTLEQAFAEVRRGRGTQFAPEVVDAFFAAQKRRPGEFWPDQAAEPEEKHLRVVASGGDAAEPQKQRFRGLLRVAAMSFGGLISQLGASRPIGGVGRAKDRRVRVVVPRRGCRGPR